MFRIRPLASVAIATVCILSLPPGCVKGGSSPELPPTILALGPIACGCDSECLFAVEGTLARALEGDEELFLAVMPVDDAASRYFLQFGDKTVNETLWTAQAQAGSADVPPQSEDVFEVYAIVVDGSLSEGLPLDPLPALSPQYIPGLLAVSDAQSLTVECEGEPDPEDPDLSPELPVLDALSSHTYWHLYSPVRGQAGESVPEDQIRSELQMLFDSGARGLVTYEMMNGVQLAPCIAKDVGFEWVLAGVYWWTNGVDNGQTDSTLEQEKAAIDNNSSCIDGIVIGNEGLLDSDEWNQPRYTVADLERELRAMAADYPGKAVTTAEGRDTYEQHPHLVSDEGLTDFVFPNLHAYWALAGSPQDDPSQLDSTDGVNWLTSTIGAEPFSLRGDRLIVMHEAWWPAEKGQDGEEDAQAAFFQGMLDAGVSFCWGETVDQPWKSGPEGSIGAHWGLWHHDAASDTYEPKEVVDVMKANSL
ncbi:MAG TPA: hypothetical protein VM243_02820 [Phycisphaerae bacterium]|nr:hypothetical protein [Phycisphaerae bacterium]